LSGAFAQNAPTGAGAQVLDFKPGFDDLMTMLVQPRHIKLFYAGWDKNWELAAFELRELRASFRRSGQAIPMYRTQDVNKAVAVMAAPTMDRVDKAIAARDSDAFAAAYDALTNSCNACHKVMEHGFLVIKVPDGSVPSQYPDQDFRPAESR
jgi:hypothetical protein